MQKIYFISMISSALNCCVFWMVKASVGSWQLAVDTLEVLGLEIPGSLYRENDFFLLSEVSDLFC